MTAVASPPSFPPLNRSAWGVNGGPSLSMNPDDVRGMLTTRRPLQRTNSSSSVSSTSSNSSTTTVATNGSQSNGTPASSTGEVSQWPNTAPRKRPQPKAPWPPGKADGQPEFLRMSGGRPPLSASLGSGPPMHQQVLGPPQNISPQSITRPLTDSLGSAGQPVLYLLPLNGTFERKTIQVPFAPDSLRIGRQTNQKTVPTPLNGFFDSKVLSRQHAEIWADRTGKIWIRDVKSSNGTFVNGTRLSQENRESEPHELQTSDHLELGIDIVSEDQKTVVHHKVAAKVEHAGFVSSSGNLLDMNFGDLDPANGAMLMHSPGGLPYRGRASGGHLMGANGRMYPNNAMVNLPTSTMGQTRPFWLSTITADQIVKKLQNEMRSARLQSQDIMRSGTFVHTLLSKDEVKESDKSELPEAPKLPPILNGSALPLRTDTKARFSDPPAPPPQQPLPEKPDVPSLKRGTTERPKSHASNTSPIHDGFSQILQLQEDLKNTKKELEGRNAKLKELEERLVEERTAREEAEDLARRLGDSARAPASGPINSSASDTVLDEAFEPPSQSALSPDAATRTSDVGKALPDLSESIATATAALQSRVDAMATEMRDLRQQMEAWRERCEKVETERDEARQSLAEMVLQRREAEARQAAARESSRSRSKQRANSAAKHERQETAAPASHPADHTTLPSVDDPGTSVDELDENPTISRANTVTPASSTTTRLHAHQTVAASSLPYASMVGVVIFGMGLMAYLNGWQPQPKLNQ